MKGLRIKECIFHHNNNLQDGEEKMTQQRLAELVMPDKEPDNALNQINKLANGKADLIYLSILRKIKEVLKVSYQQLID